MGAPAVFERVLYGMDQQVACWVMDRVPAMTGRAPDDFCAALGVVRDDQIIAGLVFHNYRAGVDIEVSLAADDPRWCRATTLRRLFAYPFVQLALPRLTCVVARKNKRCRKLVEGMGWRLEGTIRKAYDGRQDAMVYGMLPDECRFKPEG